MGGLDKTLYGRHWHSARQCSNEDNGSSRLMAVALQMRKLTRRGVLPFVLLFGMQGLPAMSLLNPTKTCVFSAVKARLTMNGQPLRGVTVIRRWEWQQLREDSAQTDERGEFSLPAVYESSATRLLPVELVVAQGLYVKLDGEEKKFWSNSKREPAENSEYKGRAISLVCELTHELKTTRDNGAIMSTLCQWGP